MKDMKNKMKETLNEQKEDMKKIFKEVSEEHDQKMEELSNSPWGTVITILFIVCIICKLFIWD